MKVKDVLKIKNQRVITVGPNETVFTALEKLVVNNIGALPVCDTKGEVVGIVSERDLLRESYRCGTGISKSKVKDVMTKDVAIGIFEDDLDYIKSIMTQKVIRHLPIMTGAKLEGIISTRDIVEAQLEESNAKVRYLSDYISGGYI